MNYYIEIYNLSKEFTHSREPAYFLLPSSKKLRTISVVNNVNLQIKNGELFGLLGPNGAGKTTLIKMLCCLILPTEGTAKVVGYDILKDEEKIKVSIGLVSGDERSFYWRLTGRQNLQFFASLYNLTSNQAETKIKELLEFFEIEEPDKRFQEYSTGIKQRLAIAKSLLNNPKVLFIDEPTKSLDPKTAQRLRVFIKDKIAKQQNITVFFATHNLEEAEYLADRLAVMAEGEIRACGRMEDIRGEIRKCFYER